MMHTAEAAGETLLLDLHLEYLPLHRISHSYFIEVVDNTFPLGKD